MSIGSTQHHQTNFLKLYVYTGPKYLTGAFTAKVDPVHVGHYRDSLISLLLLCLCVCNQVLIVYFVLRFDKCGRL